MNVPSQAEYIDYCDHVLTGNGGKVRGYVSYSDYSRSSYGCRGSKSKDSSEYDENSKGAKGGKNKLNRDYYPAKSKDEHFRHGKGGKDARFGENHFENIQVGMGGKPKGKGGKSKETSEYVKTAKGKSMDSREYNDDVKGAKGDKTKLNRDCYPAKGKGYHSQCGKGGKDAQFGEDYCENIQAGMEGKGKSKHSSEREGEGGKSKSKGEGGKSKDYYLAKESWLEARGKSSAWGAAYLKYIHDLKGNQGKVKGCNGGNGDTGGTKGKNDWFNVERDIERAATTIRRRRRRGKAKKDWKDGI